MAVFVTHAMKEGWKQQWFYSIMASSFGLHFDGLDATGTVRASSEMQWKGCHPCHHDMHSFARFCYPSFTVSLYRESRATKVVHCITVPRLFGEFYEIFHMKTREHVRSSTPWYGAVFLGNLSWYLYMLVWQFLLRMPWRSTGNGSGSTASWHRVSACNSVSHLWPVVVHLHFVAAGGSFVLALCLHCRRSRGLRINDL